MATDVYVMPLWKFKVGEFDSPLEASLGVRVMVIGPNGVTEEEPPGPPAWWRRWRAKWQVRSLQRTVSRAVGVDVRWNDEGTLAYSNQFRSGSLILAYLWWRDRRDRFPVFRDPENDQAFARELFAFEPDRRPSCQQLSAVSYFNDYFFPATFTKTARVEPYWNWIVTSDRGVASTPVALGELEPLMRELDIASGFAASQSVDGGDPLLGVKYSLDHLHTVLSHSARTGLPVIFHG